MGEPVEKLDFDSVINAIVSFLGDAARQVIIDHENQTVEEVTRYERLSGLRKSVAALCDVSNDKETIVESLRRHWGIDSFEAERYVQREMREHLPIRRLVRYLKSEKNYSSLEAKKFIEEHELPEKLKEDPDLSTMKPEQLYKKLQRRS